MRIVIPDDYQDRYEMCFGTASDNIVGFLRGGAYGAANPDAVARR